MKRIIVVIVLLLLLISCAPIATPTATADLQSTIDAGIAQTQQAEPSFTATSEPTATYEPINTPKPTNTKVPTATKEPYADYGDFIYYYKDNFDFYRKKLYPSISAIIKDMFYEKNDEGGTTLWIKTQSGVTVINDRLMAYTLIQVISMFEPDNPFTPHALPDDLDTLHIVFFDNNLQEKGYCIAKWGDVMDFAYDNITENQFYSSMNYSLP